MRRQLPVLQSGIVSVFDRYGSHTRTHEGPTAASDLPERNLKKGCLIALGIPVAIVLLVIGILWLIFTTFTSAIA